MGRFLVGIDLGTTHTVVAYADLQAGANAAPVLFEIEQLVAPGEVAPAAMLPSLRYHHAAEELAGHDTRLPWSDPDFTMRFPSAVIGELARELGSRVPGRLVASAKSWLSHPAVDRTEPILPWGAPDEIPRISPLHASASYLAHVRAAWNHRFPAEPLQNQEIIVTIPASFDEAARALTLEAARIAGLVRIRLVEEPQAAFYDWLARNRDRLGPALDPIRLVLVCDVGGGTTDFTLIQSQIKEGRPKLTRIGIGDHLMLGGDNMDLALAHLAQGRMMTAGAKLSAASLSQLILQCRSAKERLLSPDAPERTSVTVLGAGAKLIASARSAELKREEVQQMLVEGFFPRVAPDETPSRVRGGIVEFGLPYVADPAVTRHLAAFLVRYAHDAREALGLNESPAFPVPDAVLLNGGVFRSAVLSRRVVDLLTDWRGAQVTELQNEDPHLAVARGAVAYGLARYGRGPRIAGGSARAYFLLLGAEEERPRRGVCVLPRGAEEGREIRLEGRTFLLRLGQPVRFHLVSSIGDVVYRPGDLVEIDEHRFHALPPVAAELREQGEQKEVPVHLAALLSELGTLEMNCVAEGQSGERWHLEFQLRGGARAALAAAGDLHSRFGEATRAIERVFGARARDVRDHEVKGLRRELETILGDRETWEPPLLREMFATVWNGVRHRRRSPDHERVWCNLAGYCLRPGYGYPLDDWRVRQLWSIYGQAVHYAAEARVWSEWWTMWRRVAGGLDRQAHERLWEDIALGQEPAPGKKRRQASNRQAQDDRARLAGVLERLPAERKTAAGDVLLARVRKPAASNQSWWAIGRIGARVPFYGNASNVVPEAVAERWLDQALRADWKSNPSAAFAATLLARLSPDADRNVDAGLRKRVASQLRASGAPPNWVRMVEETVELGETEEQEIFGESLPPGLRLL